MKNKISYAKIVNKTEKKAEIVIYGIIGAAFYDEAMSANEFSDLLDEVGEVDELVLRINSPGGNVFQGVTIYNRIKSFSAKKKTVIVDGLAASIASVIAMAADEIIMGEATQMMIHKPAIMIRGEAPDLRKAADLLDQVEEQIIDIYNARTGIEKAELAEMMKNETWMKAETAVEKGFADKADSEVELQVAACVNEATWIKNLPEDFKNENTEKEKELSEFKMKAKKVSAEFQRRLRNFRARL